MIGELLSAVSETRRRRALGWTWTAVWCGILYTFARPWRDPSGWVDERLRWAAWAALLWGVVAGFALGRLGRTASIELGRVTHERLVRSVLFPVAVVVAGSASLLTWLDLGDPAGAAVLGLLSYWAGIDLAYGAVPLMDGEPYAFRHPLPPRDSDGDGLHPIDPDGPLL